MILHQVALGGGIIDKGSLFKRNEANTEVFKVLSQIIYVDASSLLVSLSSVLFPLVSVSLKQHR